MTAIKARCLAGSGMLEAFEAHLDVSGHVIALGWSTPTGSCQAPAASAALPADWSIAEVQRVPTRMPARGPSLHPSRPAFSGLFLPMILHSWCAVQGSPHDMRHMVSILEYFA